MKTTVNKDGSITTSVEDENPAPAKSEDKSVGEAEAKVVKTPAKAAPKARSTSESK